MNEAAVQPLTLEVELPVCPRCGTVGRQPGKKGTGYQCIGPTGGSHKKTRMILRRFRLVEDDGAEPLVVPD